MYMQISLYTNMLYINKITSENTQDLIEANTYSWEEENIYVNICRMHEYKSIKTQTNWTK